MPNLVFVVNKVVVICRGCTLTKVFHIDPPFRSALEFTAWQRANVPALVCPCGSEFADIKLMLVDQN